MAEITAALVKELRERTQVGMSDCKAALVEAGGDIEKAVEIILTKGLAKAAAKAGKIAAEGEVRTLVSADGKRGTIVEINCQTDFVARGDTFKEFVGKVLEVASKLPKGSDLLAQKYPGSDKTVEDIRKEMVSKTGENTVVRRWDALEARGAHGIVHSYIHMGGKLAVLVEAEAPHAEGKGHDAFKGFVDNSAMQIAAMNPLVVQKDEIGASHVEKQKEIFAGQLKEEGKPEQAWPKIIEGKVNKWFTEVTLLGQESVVDPGKTVDAIRKDLSKQLGGDVHIHAFVRYSLGEGIEKGPKDDLAAEVAKMTGG
jgi:elongation factor Ts